jgi:hypothetical protein
MTKQEQTKQIEVELAACRAAWAQFFADNKLKSTDIRFTDNTPIQAWCLHHTQLIERLEEPVENRIAYILRSKPLGEQACRFLNLRPISLTSIKVCDSAQAEYSKVRDPAWAEYCKVRDPAWAEYDKVCDAAHLVDVPNHTWNGTSIFKQ